MSRTIEEIDAAIEALYEERKSVLRAARLATNTQYVPPNIGELLRAALDAAMGDDDGYGRGESDWIELPGGAQFFVGFEPPSQEEDDG